MVGSILLIIVAYFVWCGITAFDKPAGGITDYNRFFCTHSGMSKSQIRREIRRGRW